MSTDPGHHRYCADSYKNQSSEHASQMQQCNKFLVRYTIQIFIHMEVRLEELGTKPEEKIENHNWNANEQERELQIRMFQLPVGKEIDICYHPERDD